MGETSIEPRLFRGTTAGFSIHGHFEIGRGWLVTTAARYEGESWAEGPTGSYEALVTPEAYDVACATLASYLGL